MEQPTSKRGRPPKAPDDRRATELRIMLTEAERNLFNRVAQGKGGTSTWARGVLIRAAKEAAKG
jgi:hypothetical protein